jgi:glycogen debranching enzyme
MPFKVEVGPPQIAIHHGQTVLVTDLDAQIRWPSERGLFFFDTRVLSSWRIYANGVPWDLLNGGATSYYTSHVYLTNGAILTEDGAIPPRTLGLVVSRSIAGGMHEDLDITNNSMKWVRFQLEIALRSDFADIFEVRSGSIVRRGRITTEWSDSGQQLRTMYRNADFMRSLTVTPERDEKTAVYANGRISFEVVLSPGEAWHCCLLYALMDGELHFAAPHHCVSDSHKLPHAVTLADWLRTVLKIRTSNEEFYRLYHQALEDMAALRLPIGNTDHMVFLPAAGLPWFIAPFGRDSLIASLQNLLIYPGFARGALEILGSLQAREHDDYRDAEPGKIPHEMRFGELAHFRLIPHTPYFGTADATPLYLITLHATWCATGDRTLLEKHLETAERCLFWIDNDGDRDGDGFQEYQTRSPVGYENMGWKDSGDAVVYPDGSLVKGPKALCELQGYVYDAWLRMAEIFDELGKHERARELRGRAAGLFERFNDVFWDDDLGFYAYALDGDKKKVLTVVSNPGHCLWSGIVPPERAAKVVQRLMAPDMWSGWGIRTLSSKHRAFNPYNYQTGSVWPHDNAIIAIGFKRYGFGSEAARIARAISAAGSHFLFNQLPELYTSTERRQADFPVQYLGANVPQAWAAGSVFTLMQVMLGIMPDARTGKLYLDPELPSWLPDLTVLDLRMDQYQFDIRFWREGEETKFEVLRGNAKSVERSRMGVQFDRLKREQESTVPGGRSVGMR